MKIKIKNIKQLKESVGLDWATEEKHDDETETMMKHMSRIIRGEESRGPSWQKKVIKLRNYLSNRVEEMEDDPFGYDSVEDDSDKKQLFLQFIDQLDELSEI